MAGCKLRITSGLQTSLQLDTTSTACTFARKSIQRTTFDDLQGGTAKQATGHSVKKVTDISQGSVATHSRCGGIFDNLHKFTVESHRQRILQTGWHLDSYWQQNSGIFSSTVASDILHDHLLTCSALLSYLAINEHSSLLLLTHLIAGFITQ